MLSVSCLQLVKLRRTLREMAEEKFQKKKSLGQHFLNSNVVSKWMCDAGAVDNSDLILEVGPGTGALTRELLARGAKVIALEADLRAITVLKETFKEGIDSGQLALLHQDVRELNLADIQKLRDHSYKVIANIPYYLSGMLFRTFLENDIQPSSLVFLVQKEVAKRITADISKGGKESLLSLSVKAFGVPIFVRHVFKSHFTPQPKVDSAIIKIENIGRENFKDIDRTIFFHILHLGFGQKRKQLLGNLTAEYDRNTLLSIFSTLGVNPHERAEDIPIKTWLKLVHELSLHT